VIAPPASTVSRLPAEAASTASTATVMETRLTKLSCSWLACSACSRCSWASRAGSWVMGCSSCLGGCRRFRSFTALLLGTRHEPSPSPQACAVSAAPESFRAALEAQREGRVAEAAALYRATLAEHPAAAPAYHNLAAVLGALGL